MNCLERNLSQNRLWMLLLPCVPMPEYGNTRNFASLSFPTKAPIASAKTRCFAIIPLRAATASAFTCLAAASDNSLLTANPVMYAPFVPCVYDEEGRISFGKKCASASSRDCAPRTPKNVPVIKSAIPGQIFARIAITGTTRFEILGCRASARRNTDSDPF